MAQLRAFRNNLSKKVKVTQSKLSPWTKIIGHSRTFLGDKYELSRRQFVCTSKALKRHTTCVLKFPLLETYEKLKMYESFMNKNVQWKLGNNPDAQQQETGYIDIWIFNW